MRKGGFMDFDEIIEQFAAAAGLEGFRADDDGVYRLLIDGMPVSACPADDGHIALFAPVGEPPPDAVAGRERLYRTLLESAHLGRGTASASFSIDAETGEIYLQRLESAAGLDCEGFKLLLENFVDVLAEWRRIVADFRPIAAKVDEEAREDEKLSRNMGVDGFLQV